MQKQGIQQKNVWLSFNDDVHISSYATVIISVNNTTRRSFFPKVENNGCIDTNVEPKVHVAVRVYTIFTLSHMYKNRS